MSPDLATMVGSRICHDLISPIGAISNGVELMALTNGASGAEMELIAQSVENAAAKIKFFRIAYGAATDRQTISETEVKSILSALAESGRVTYDWQVQSDQPRNVVRSAFLTLQAIESALPRGGIVTIDMCDGQLRFIAQGQRIDYNQDRWASLGDATETAVPDAAHIQFALLRPLLKALGRPITYSATETQLSVAF